METTREYTLQAAAAFMVNLTILTDTWEEAYEQIYGERPEGGVAPVQQPEKPIITKAEEISSEPVAAVEEKREQDPVQEGAKDDTSDHEERADELGGAGDVDEPGADEGVPAEAESEEDRGEDGEAESGRCAENDEKQLWYAVRQKNDELNRCLAIYGSEDHKTEDIDKIYSKAVEVAHFIAQILVKRGDYKAEP